jgi:hypothetical protein
MNLESFIRIISIAGAAVAFCWGAYEFLATQRGQADTRRIEATRPFLDRQLLLYTEATQAAATLATATDAKSLASAEEKFWSLYWGALALVEDKKVEGAMVLLGNALRSGQKGAQLQPLSLGLAHACRDSLAESWGVSQWRNPHSTDVP